MTILRRAGNGAANGAGVRLALHLDGPEIRVHEDFAAAEPCAWAVADDHALAGRTTPDVKPAAEIAVADALRREIARRAAGLAHRVVVPDPEVARCAPGAVISPPAPDLGRLERIGAEIGAEDGTADGPIRIAHAPDRRGRAGTDAVIAAVDALAAAGIAATLDLIEGAPPDDRARRLARADIVVDEMRRGWFGPAAREAMALGKPVIAHIGADIGADAGPDASSDAGSASGPERGHPVVAATPRTLTETLRALAADPARRRDLGASGRAFAARIGTRPEIRAQTRETRPT